MIKAVKLIASCIMLLGLGFVAPVRSALPDQLRSKTPWRNPRHQRELFAIRVE